MEPWKLVTLVENSDIEGPSLVAIWMEYFFAYQFWYWNLCWKNLWGGERKRYLLIFSCRDAFNVGRWGLVQPSFIQQSWVTNSMHLQTTYSPHLQYLQSEVHLESSQTSAVELFCGNSQGVKTVDYFRKRAPSCIFGSMFDKTLNATLPNNLL